MVQDVVRDVRVLGLRRPVAGAPPHSRPLSGWRRRSDQPGSRLPSVPYARRSPRPLRALPHPWRHAPVEHRIPTREAGRTGGRVARAELPTTGAGEDGFVTPNEKRPLAGALPEAYAPRQRRRESILTNPADDQGHSPSVSVASTPRGGVSCDDEAMRLRRTVGVGIRALCVAKQERSSQ